MSAVSSSATTQPVVTAQITGLIIAGGLARRMGGSDKGLQLLCGKPLLAHVIERFSPQVGRLQINANHNASAYAAFGYPLVADTLEGYAGPLAGLQAGLAQCATPLLATVPCDTPFLPHDLVARLHAALEAVQAPLAVATTAGWTQHTFMLCRREVLPSLNAFLAAGERKIGRWYETLDAVEVPFADEAAFANINTPEELEQFERAERSASLEK